MTVITTTTMLSHRLLISNLIDGNEVTLNIEHLTLHILFIVKIEFDVIDDFLKRDITN